MVLILVGMLLFVVPMFERMYSELGGSLPLPTQILIDVSNIVKKFFIFMAAGAGLLAFLFRTMFAVVDPIEDFLGMIDVDHFKSFNDTHGHLVGDSVLRFVAAEMEQCVKGRDLLSRYGGEEFLVILRSGRVFSAKYAKDSHANVGHFKHGESNLW